MTNPTRNLILGLCALVLFFLVGVGGYRFARWGWSDSFYMVVISVFSLDYGEVKPIQEEGLRGLTILIIVMGCLSVIFVSSSLVQVLLEGQLRRVIGYRRMNAEIAKN